MVIVGFLFTQDAKWEGVPRKDLEQTVLLGESLGSYASRPSKCATPYWKTPSFFYC